MSIFKKLLILLRAITGWHNIYDGSTCEVSKELWDVHDYHHRKGGNGVPAHLYTYTCSACGEEFSI